MAIHHPTPPLGGGERPRLAARHYSRLEQCSGGPVTQAIRAMRSADAAANLAPVFPSFGEKFTQGIRALSRAEIEADEKLSALRVEVAEMVARGREIRVRAFLAMRRARVAMRQADVVLASSRATLVAGAQA